MSSTTPPAPAGEETSHHPSPATKEDDANKWGTQVMGPPANPTTHPENQRAALWKAGDQEELYLQYHQQQHQHQQPYLVHSPVEKPPNNPFEAVANMFNTWTRKADSASRNIWHNLNTGPSLSEAVCGKIGLRAKAISGGGFDSLFKQTFDTEPNEKLKKTFACYLSTTAGPVALTLYLSTHRIAFCSDRPLSSIAPSGQETWSYYKVMIPLGRVSTVNPVNMRENPAEKYIQIITIDEHEFWLMGFVNYEKASRHLLESVFQFRAAEQGGASVGYPLEPAPAPQ